MFFWEVYYAWNSDESSPATWVAITFHSLTSEDINDVISHFYTVENGKQVWQIGENSKVAWRYDF